MPGAVTANYLPNGRQRRFIKTACKGLQIQNQHFPCRRPLAACCSYFSKVRQQCLNDGPPDFGAAMVWRARVDAETAAKFGFPEGTTISYFGNNRVVLLYTVRRLHTTRVLTCKSLCSIGCVITYLLV